MEYTTLKVRPSKMNQWVDVYFIGCLHEGHANHAEAEAKESVRVIRENIDKNPYTYVVLMGDMAEFIVSQGDPRWDPIGVADKYGISDLKDLAGLQVENVAKLFEPVKNNVIAYIVGNHEESYVKHHSSDVYKRLADHFPFCKRLGRVGWLSVFLENEGKDRGCEFFSFALTHGDSGTGKTIGNIYNKIYDLFAFKRADFCIGAHWHRMCAKDIVVELPSPQGRYIDYRKVWLGSCGCYLWKSKEGTRSYYEHKPGPESDVGMLKASFRILKTNRMVGGKRNTVRLRETKLREIIFRRDQWQER